MPLLTNETTKKAVIQNFKNSFKSQYFKGRYETLKKKKIDKKIDKKQLSSIKCIFY